jgi:hypothetical protein
MQKRFKLAKRIISTPGEYKNVNMRCPECHRQGTFDQLVNDTVVFPSDEAQGGLWVGYRVCPNYSCNLLVITLFTLSKENGYTVPIILASYPAERIDFDASSIPDPIVNALEEAITCHSNGCYIAAAIMVRKTLEELCHHQGATGKRLVDQIVDLKTKVIVPVGLLDGIDNLRLLGNDAAHIELKDFDQIGQEEVEVGILLAKELLKAVYQSSMLADRLKALKK